MFALPFLGAIAKDANRSRCKMESWHNCRDVTTFEEFLKVRKYNIENMTHVPAGACKVYHSYNGVDGARSGRDCKQADGSWKKVPDHSKFE